MQVIKVLMLVHVLVLLLVLLLVLQTTVLLVPVLAPYLRGSVFSCSWFGCWQLQYCASGFTTCKVSAVALALLLRRFAATSMAGCVQQYLLALAAWASGHGGGVTV